MTSHAIAPPLKTQSQGTLFARRLFALLLRHVYLHLNSWPRFIEMLYWPLINLLTWGFTSAYLIKKLTNVDIVSTTMVAGVLLGEVLVRMTITVLMLFLEEIWSRNLGHLFASPLRFFDYVVGLAGTAILRAGLAMIPAFIVAWLLFDFSPARLGWPVVAQLALLTFNGIWYGMLILSILFRHGLAAEWLAWMATWLLIPFIAPYYPVDILPHAAQYISYSLPATYVFESVKSIVAGQGPQGAKLLIALGLNLAYFAVASCIFLRAYRGARRRGGLLQMGE